MSGKAKYTAAQFLKVIPGTGGIISAIARKIGCDWITAKRYIQKHATVLRAWRAEKETVLDVAETKLIKDVKDGETWAVKFYLKTQGKDRGYVEKQVVAIEDVDGAINAEMARLAALSQDRIP